MLNIEFPPVTSLYTATAPHVKVTSIIIISIIMGRGANATKLGLAPQI